MSANDATVILPAPPGATVFPEVEHYIPPTPHVDLDRAVTALNSRKQAWIQVSCAERVTLIEEMLRLVERVAPAWVKSACQAKDLPLTTHQAGEEWLTGPYITARNLRLLARSLRDISRRGVPHLPQRPEL